jgi:PKD repeat protein
MKINSIMITAILVSSLILAATLSVKAADLTVTDPVGDVASVDPSYNTSGVVHSPYVTVANLDITEVTFTKNAGTATVSLFVSGAIEDRGTMEDLQLDNPTVNVIGYTMTLTSSDESYSVTYVNQSCQLMYSNYTTVNLTDSQFSTNGQELTITFSLISPDEQNFTLEAQVMFIKMSLPDNIGDLNNIDEETLSQFYVTLLDIAPNLPLTSDEIMTYVTNVGLVGESIQFNGSVSPLAGQPPYEYKWNFGDKTATSTDTAPVHTYAKAGTYTYNFTVTDHTGEPVSVTGEITITKEGGGGLLSTQMLLFLVIMLIIIVVGVVIIIWIIRR